MSLMTLLRSIVAAARPGISDKRINLLYPPEIRIICQRHWTPVRVIKKAAAFLAPHSGSSILDIGSGIGKFCLVAGMQHPHCHFYGIEQRQSLIEHAEHARQQLNLSNVSFVHANITEIDFSRFNHFYFFNSFYENLENTDKIDMNIEYSRKLYDYYTNYLYEQFSNLPAGTRLVTYHANEQQVPGSYRVISTAIDNLLQCRIKE